MVKEQNTRLNEECEQEYYEDSEQDTSEELPTGCSCWGGCGAEILEAGWEVREVRGSSQILESFIGRVKI